MPTLFRRDDWIQDALGNAQAGAGVYVCSQPANPGYIDEDTGIYVPPTPQVQLYADPNRITALTQPVLTDGYGHAFYYVASGTYTVTYYSPYIAQTTLQDQFIGGQAPQVNNAAPLGVIDGSNRVFTLASTPTSFLMYFLNGVLQLPGGINYVISGPTITMTNAPEVGDQIWAVYQ